jgi:rubrerythrin
MSGIPSTNECLLVGGKQIPTLEVFNVAIRNKEMHKSRAHLLSKAGIQHVKLGIQLLSSTSDIHNGKILFETYGQHLSKYETRAWRTLSGDQRQKKNYSIENDRLCFKGDPVIGWDEFYEKIVEVVRSLSHNPSSEMLDIEVEKLHPFIPKSVVESFCKLCGSSNARSNNSQSIMPFGDGGGRAESNGPLAALTLGGVVGTSINLYASLAFGGGGGGGGGGAESIGSNSVINPFPSRPFGVGVGGQTINPFQLPAFGAGGPVFQNTTNYNTCTDNSVHHNHNYNHTIDSSLVEKIDLLVAGQVDNKAILQKIQLQTEQRQAPSSALREERNLQAEAIGATSLFQNFEEPSPECLADEQDGMHATPKQKSITPTGMDPYIELMGESFNVMNGSDTQTDGFILDPAVVKAEEELLEQIKISAMEKEEERRKRFSTYEDDSVQETGIIACGWKGTDVGISLEEANEKWKCHVCSLQVSREKNVCPACGFNNSVSGINSMLSAQATGLPSYGTIPFSFGIPLQVTKPSQNGDSTTAKLPFPFGGSVGEVSQSQGSANFQFGQSGGTSLSDGGFGTTNMLENFAFGNAPAPASLTTFGSSATTMTMGSSSRPTFAAASSEGSFGSNAPPPLN